MGKEKTPAAAGSKVEDAVRACLEKYPGKTLIAAVSGGADSTALLAACAKLKDEFSPPIQIICVHINHNLRGEESRRDAEFVRGLCKRFQIPCKIVTIREGLIKEKARGLGIEAAARNLRHRILRIQAKKAGAVKILTGHNSGDRIETILMRLLRGAGAAGLAAMQPQKGKLIRPLLHIKRSGILDFLRQENLDYCTDSTNNSLSYLRNRIRLKLIPFLDGNFPNWEKGISEFAATQAYIASYLKEQVQKILENQSGAGPEDPPVAKPPENPPEAKKSAAENPPEAKITIQNFTNYPQILQEELIFELFDRLTKTKPQNFFPDETEKRLTAPRRSSVRKLLAQTPKKANLPGLIIEYNGGALTASPAQSCFEQGNIEI